MIYLSFEGGLGNQMFQYAIGRYMERKFHESVCIDCSKYEYESIEFRDFELQHFNISPDWKYAKTKKNRFLRYGINYIFYLLTTFLYLRINKMRSKGNKDIIGAKAYQWITNRLGFYRVHYNEKLFLYDSFGKKKYVRGMWFYLDIVCSLKENLKKELSVKEKPSPDNQVILEQICSNESVGVHIRRGDYVTLGLVVCDLNYYRKCMAIIAEKVENPIFFIFSDDIQWVKENLNTQYNVVYVDNNNSSPEDMRLLYSCKHFIMSNSTFSWWGAYLGNYENKIVLVPKYWNVKKKKSDLILDDWIAIENI